MSCGGSNSDDADAASSETTTTAPTTTTAAPTTTTAAPSTTSAAPAIIPGEDADVDDIVNAFSKAFDSNSDYDAKAPFIDDPTGLEETVAQYLTNGEMMGGVGVQVTAVEVDGDEAEVTYDLLFNDNPSYRDLPGTAVLTDEGWKVPRAVFCALMSSARAGCPSD